MAQFNEEDRKWLYDTMKAKGVDTGSYDEFAKSLGNKADREWYYQKGKEFGLDLGSQQDFDDMMYDRGSGLQGSLQQRMYPNGVKPEKPIVAAQPQPTRQNVVQPQQQEVQQAVAPLEIPQGFGQLDMTYNQFGRQSWEQPEQEPHEETFVGKQQRMLSGKATPQEQQQTQNAMRQRMDEIAYEQETGKRLRQPVLNTEFEAPTVERDENGRILIGNTTDESRVKAHQQIVQDQKEFDEERALMQKLGLGGDIPEFDFKSADLQLEEAELEKEELEKQLEKGRFNAMDWQGDATWGPKARKQRGHEDYDNLEAALHFLNRRIAAIKGEVDDPGLIRGTTDVLTSQSALSMGLTDLEDAAIMSSLKERIDAVGGDVSKLSASEKALIRNVLLEQKAQRYNANRNGWYQTGEQLGNTLNFMKDFYITGGGYASLAKQGARMGTKAGLKFINSGVAKAVSRNLGVPGKVLNKSIQYGLKYGGLAAGAEAGGALLAGTVQLPKTAANIINRHTGNLTIDSDKKLSFEGGEELGKAALYEFLKASGENASELVGPMFDFMPKILGRTIANTTTGRMLKGLTDNKYWRKGEKILDYGGIQGLWGEGMEEEAGMMRTQFLNYITGGEYDPNAESITDIDTHLDTWYTTLVTGALLRGPQTVAAGYSQVQHYGDRYNLNRSDKNMKSVLGDERYQNIKSALDEATNNTFGTTLGNIMRNGGLSNQEKEAVMFYANDLVKLRGDNIGELMAKTNGIQEPPKVVSYNIRGNSFDEVGVDGKVLNHYEFENSDDMKAALYESQQKRFDEGLQSDISVMKTRPNDEYTRILSDYCEQAGIEQSVLEAALAKPSMERDDVEQAMVESFAKLLHSTVYDNTMTHTEQSAQDGAQLADEMSIDLNNLSPGQVEQAQQITADFNAAKQALDQAFANNEDLKQEVERLQNEQMPAQGIVSSLGDLGFRPNEVQAVIDYYNADAKFKGFVLQMSQKINEAAANERQRHILKGTIDGEADVSNVHTITDGTNRYYLVSGDVTTDKTTGWITGSSSGLIIGMDLDGSFVQIKDTDGYSVEPVMQTLDQWEEEERTRLQEQMTEVVDPNQTLVPQEQGGNLDNAGGEAGVVGNTGGNDPSATAPSVETQQQTEQPLQIPVDEKTGVKLYEQGVPVDQAIDDLQKDGRDVNSWSDLAINEAQEELSKMKQPKTRAELIKNEARAKELQNIIDYYNKVKERLAERNAEAQPAESEEIVNIQPEQPNAPEYRYDTPAAARKRGFKIVEGQRIDRQEEKPMPQGMEVEVQYSTKDKVKGHLTVSELGEVQGSHLVNGQRNEKNFIPEAQPKAEFGADRQAAAQSNASEDNFRPELMLTFNGTQSAYSGSTTQTNRRGEVIQGNGRRNLAEFIYAPGNEAVAQRYKEFLMAHAEELGTTAEEIAKMEKPFAHIVLDVTDEEAIRLGQFTAADLETGGKKIPEVASTATKLGDKFSNLANIVLRHEDPDASLAERIEANADEAVRWLNQGGYINNTEAKTLLEDKAAARQFIKDLLTDTLFSGASPDLRTMFYELPKNIQSAIVSVIGREVVTSPNTTILKDIQESIQAYHELVTSSPQFAGAKGKNFEERFRAVTAAVNDWLRQINIDGTLNNEKYSNFALHLAKLYQSLKDQKTLAAKLREYYDLVSGSTRQLGMFDDNTTSGPVTREEAIKQIFGVEYGRQGTVPLAGDIQAGQGGEQGSSDRNSGGERREGETGPSDTGGRDTGNAPEGEVGSQTQSREDYLASHPLTEEQIMADTEATEDEKLNAIDFLNGEDSVISRFYYDQIYERTQKTSSSENRQKKEEKKPTKEKKEEKPQQPQPKWQYQFHYDKETGRAWITRDDVSGSIPIGDGRFRIEGNSLAELRAILENPKNNLGELLKEVEAPLHNAEVGERIRNAETPTEAIEQAAQSFAQEQKSKDQQDIDDALKEFNDFLDNAKGSSVLGKFMRKGLEGNDKAQASLLDAFTLTNDAQRMFLKDLLRLASKVGYAYIKSGVHDVQAWSKKMSDSIGAKLREVLGWDDNIIGEFVDEVWNQRYTVDGQRMRLSEHAERLKNGKGVDTTVNVNKQENNEPENVVSSQQEENLQGDSAEYAEQQEKIERLRNMITDRLRSIVRDGYAVKPLSEYKKFVEIAGIKNMSDTDLQEIIEACIVDLAREFANDDLASDEKKFNWIVKLYNGQPTLSVRDNDRINKQQYSTPAPMAFLMGQFLSAGKEVESGLEPSAGNGMLTINLPKEKMHVNDIDEMRLSNLQKQGFGEVTSQDGLQSFGEKKFDVVVTNPPFGNVTPKVYDGIYEISGLEHQMAINALESMKDDGRAAIIIGGNTEYNTNGTIKGKDRAFLNYLYAHYNVVDVINMDGKTLYSRQGTGFPVRMILINGRKEFSPRNYAPVQSKARAERVNSYDELFKRVNDDILRDTEHNGDTSNGVHTAESGQNGGLSDNGHVSPSNEAGVRNVRTGRGSGEHQLPTESVVGVQRSNASTESKGRGRNTESETNGGLGARSVLLHGRGNQSEQSGGSETVPSRDRGREVVDGGSNTQRLPGESVDSRRGLSVEQPERKRELGTEKVPYRQQSSNPFSLQSQMPAEQAEVVKKALEDLGDVDQFLVDELGYANKEDLHRALAAEQIDSVALAIHQMKNGDAFIIGDQTGIGKGRQGAALIRWAVKNGTPPVYFTAKPELFSSVYRDIKDIGSDGLRPFILASDKTKARIVEEKDGKQTILYDLPSDKEQKRVLEYINKNGKLPPEYDFMITTYSQVGNGTMEYENGQKKARNYGKNKKATTADYNGQVKRDAIETLAANSVAIMDESHLAGGDSARGNYLQYVSTKAKGITYISATFAKRPDNMPLYSLRTAISKAGVKVSELIDAVKRGGATFQEIMSKALTEAGQMIRRERDMTGVTVDWKGIEDEDVIKKHYKQYDQVIGLFNDIIDFQRRYVDPIVNKMNDDAAEEQGEVEHTPGTRDMGINNTPFASRTHQIVKQVLLSLKALEGAKFAIECLKNDEKPVITLENTNEGAADKATGGTEEDMEMPDLSINLKQGLKGTLRISKKDAFGNTANSEIPFDRLSEEGQRRYAEIMDAIENASTGLSLSPIDVIKNEIRKAGFSVAELTGRKKEFVYNEDGTVKRVNRADTDNKKNASDFNNGRIDALILNKSAGTGIDLHASTKFDDQRQRHMIVVQAQSDINDEVQVRGRTDRTGQRQHSKYTYIVSTIPSEQRLLMMLKAKLRSLDANTTSSQKSKFNEMQVQDIINKYGDDIVIQYLSEHPDMAAKMVDPLKWTQKFGEGFESMAPETLASDIGIERGEAGSIASKVLGRMALLKVAEQEKMLSEIGDLYQAEIDRLNEMGENDLEITEMPLRAKTVKKNVWEEGVEPGGKNPFADNSYVEEVEMDVLKKPMKGSEVKASQERLLSGKSEAEYRNDIRNNVREWESKKKEETRKTITERAEKKAKAEQEKYVKGAKKAQKKNGMTDAEIEKNGKFQYDHFYKEEMEKLTDAIESIEKQAQVFIDAIDTFSLDGVYALPTDIYDLSQLTFEPSFGRVIDIDIKEDNYSTTASTITFATLDGRRKITIPINGMVKQNNGEKRDIKPIIVQQTAQARNGFFGSNIANMLKVLEQNPDNWDKLTSTATRKKGHIITGNLLKALTSLRSQGKGGKLISYTTDTGEIRQGILMGDNFDPGSLTSKNPISSVTQIMKDGGQVVSADGDVVITKTDGIDWSHTKPGRHTEWFYQLGVPKSKKRGEKYFNDETLLSLMDDQFEGTSRMRALFPERNLNAVLKRLDELGVTVESANEGPTKNEISSVDPMEAIEQAAESWRQENQKGSKNPKKGRIIPKDVDKSVSLQIEDAFDKAVEQELEGLSEEERDAVVAELEKEMAVIAARSEANETHTDKSGKKHLVEGLSDIEDYYTGIINDEERGNRRERRTGNRRLYGRDGRSGVESLQTSPARLAFSRLAIRAIERERKYREARGNALRAKYGIDSKGYVSPETVKRIFDDMNTNKALKALFDKVFDVVSALGVKYKTDTLNTSARGKAGLYSKTITIDFDKMLKSIASPQQMAQTLLHEMIHEATNNAMTLYNLGGKYRAMLTREQQEAIEEIQKLYADAKAHPERFYNGEDTYALEDEFEFASEAANSRTRADLGRNKFLQAVWKVLKKLFGLDKLADKLFPSDINKLDKAILAIVNDFTNEQYQTVVDNDLGLVDMNGNQLYKRTPSDIVDPMEAIERAAEAFKLEREEAEALKEYSAKEVYNQRVNTAAFVTSEAFQDGMIGLKTAQNAITHDKEIPDSQNAYMAENLMHGKSAIEQEMFDSTVRGPLLEVVNRIMQKTGMSYDDIDKYTLTKSGLERNREFFVRDWLEKERKRSIGAYEELNEEEQEIYNKMANGIVTKFEDGDITEEQMNKKLEQAVQEAHDRYINDIEQDYLRLKKKNYQKILVGEMDFPEYLDVITGFIQQNIDGDYAPDEHDYSGLTALYGDEEGKYDEASIIDNLMDTEKKMGILSDILWSRINIASQYGLDRYRQAGMRSDEQLDKIEQMFHWYVPMRGFKEDTAEDMYQYFTSTNNDTKHLGGLIRHAKGHKHEAFSPIVSLINMSYKAITDCNQNMVNQKLYRLVQANPNDLIVLSDSWAELDQNTGEWEAAYPQIPEEATEEEVRQEVMAFEEDMKQKALEGTAKKIKGKADFDYKPASKKMKAQHTVEVYLNGQRKLMTIVGNPRAAQALNGQTRFKADLVPYISDMNTAIKNWMSKASTSYNPTFAARNMSRDWTHFKAILITREGMDYASAAGDYYKPTSMMSLFKKYRQGQLDESVEEERDFKDFIDNGGTTGFIHMMKLESLQKDMQKQLKKMEKDGVLKLSQSAIEGILGSIEAMNEAIENAARFATYRASRHYAQRTKARSAYDAKEVTANFNRRGSGIRTAGFKSNHTKKVKIAGKTLFEYKDVEAMAKAMGLTAQILGEGRMFFNATLQAVATIFKNFKNPDGSLNWPYIRRFASRYAATSFIMSNLVTAANMALVMLFGGDDGDDPYANLPEWVRRKNICLWLGWIPGIEKMLPKGTEYTKFFKDDFLTIPIGQELAAFYSLGDLFAGLTYAPNLKPVDLDLYNEFVSFLNVFSPVDFETKITEKEGLQRVFPEIVGRVSTVLAPTVAISENVSWTGRRIFRADKFEGDEDIPEYLMAYNSTNGGFVSISKWLNDINGDEVEKGSIQVNPGQMQYFVEQYGGGPAKLAMNTGSFAHDIYEWMFDEGKDANFNVRKVEIGKAFVQQADENQKYYRTRAKYEKYRKEANILERKIKKYEEGSVENPVYLLRVNELKKGVDAARMDIINSVENDLKKANKMIMSAKGDERKRLNDKYNKNLSRVVAELDNVPNTLKKLDEVKERVKQVVDMPDEVGKE